MKRKKKQTTQAPQHGPPEDFCDWWNPSGTDQPSGASIGGHPDAQRVWARKDPGRWSRREYGINARMAWESRKYRDEYEEWRILGQPEIAPFISITRTLEEQAAFWRGLKDRLALIGKPMPKIVAEIRNPLTNLPQEQPPEDDEGPIPF